MSDDLLALSEREALNEYLDEINTRRLRQLMWLMMGVFLLYGIGWFSEGSIWRGLLGMVVMLVDLGLFLKRRHPLLARNVRQAGSILLVSHLMVLQALNLEGGLVLGFWFVLFALLATRFRLATGETVALYGSLLAVQTARLIGESLIFRQPPPFGELAVYFLIAYLPLFGISWGLSQRRESRFLARWRAEAGRHRERVRMKRELEYARQIQLSMLPRGAPDVGWLDIAALSLPATEVGGDYYDYFHLDSDRLAVVVGDVTGHGVASGLVLSGVRSSLNLLHEDLGNPRKVLERVNGMLKRTSTPRMLMTLALAVLDRRERSVALATAGHPPMLVLRSASGVVDEVGRGSFPLGAIADETYPELRSLVAAGDVLLLYSDGLVEATNKDDEQYGWGRLCRELSRQAQAASAKEIRDALLRDIWSFKGNVEQLDDITMVVIRVVDEGSLGAAVRSGARLSFDV